MKRVKDFAKNIDQVFLETRGTILTYGELELIKNLRSKLGQMIQINVMYSASKAYNDKNKK